MLVNDEFMSRCFETESRESEHAIIIHPEREGGFAVRHASLVSRYRASLRALGLTPESAVFCRIYVSDILNQAEALQLRGLISEPEASPVAVSIVQQPPLPNAKISLLAYHVTDPSGIRKRRLGAHHVLVEKNGARHLWTTRLCAGANAGTASVAGQTRGVFEALIKGLEENGASLRENCVRTWIYVKDIDVFYSDVVKNQRALFTKEGLTERHALYRFDRNRRCMRAQARRGGNRCLFAARPRARAALVPQQL